MENVPAVCGSSSIKPWNEWLAALHKLGYTNYYKILNAKDYQIPQNRERCFMLSILGEYSFSFPFPMPQTHDLESFIYKGKLDKWYYLPDEVVKGFLTNEGEAEYP